MKPLRIASLGIWAVLFVAAGCRDSPSPDGAPIAQPALPSVADSVISRAPEPIERDPEAQLSQATSWVDGQPWTISEVWRLGGTDATGPEVFGEILAISIGPHGHVFVLDGQTLQITAFDDHGRFLRRFGGRGDGPGEFRTPQAVAWDELSQLWVADLMGRYTVMDSLGTVVRTLPRTVSCVYRRPSTGIFDADGTFVDERCISPGSGVIFYRVDDSGTVVDTFPPIDAPRVDLRADSRPLPTGVITGLRTATQIDLEPIAPFRPRLVYRVRDGHVWFAESSRLRLIQRDLNGDTVTVIEATHRDDLALTVDQDRLIDETMRLSRLDRNDFAYGHQVVEGIQILNSGDLLVQIDDQTDTGGTAIDVFDPQGRFLGSLRLALTLDPDLAIVSRGDTIVAVATDEWNVGMVVRAVIHRPPS